MKVLRIVGAFGFINNKDWTDRGKRRNIIGGTQVQSYLLTKNLNKSSIMQDVFTRNVADIDMPFKNVTFYSCGMHGDVLFPFYAIRHSHGKKYDIIHVHVGISSAIPLTALLLAKLKKSQVSLHSKLKLAKNSRLWCIEDVDKSTC